MFKMSIKRLIYLISALFLILAAVTVKTVIDKDSFMSSSYNKRLAASSDDVKRGNIEDANGTILAQSVLTDDGYKRIYSYPEYVSNITGYTAGGKSGAESTYNHYLEKAENELWQRIKSVVFKDEIECNSVVLTIDTDLQETAFKALNGNKGSVVVMDADTGKIKAMISSPSYNSNTIAEDWSALNEREDAPLLNRAAQGLYPPGSTFKIITLLSAMRNCPEALDEEYECTGTERFKDKTIRCFNETAHGKLNAEKAFALSCNCYFANLGKKIGSADLRKTAEELCFNSGIGFDFSYSVSRMEIESFSTESELIETSIGQGKTLVTPLNMAMITAAAVNDGVMMKPYILDCIKNPKDEKENITLPQILLEAMTESESQTIRDYMLETVESGTGKAAAIAGKAIGGKTGTAENPEGSDHLWFTGYCGNTVVTVVLENPDGSIKATEAARRIFEKITE